MGKLTALAVKAATQPGRYHDGDGLMLIVKPSGSRSWVVRLQADGKRRDFGLGSLKDVGLAQAREEASRLRKAFRSGVDPVEEKRAAKLARLTIPTFRIAAEAAHDEQKAGWRNKKHRQDWLSSVRSYAFPALGDTRIDKIDAPMIRDVLMPIWLTKPETARRVRQRIRTIMSWAASKGYRPPLDFTVMDAGLPKQPRKDGHFAAMEWASLPAFMAKVQGATETNGRLALMFNILTAARSGETREATWAEIDMDAAEWTIPADRMKAEREHVVPLSEPALAILRRAQERRISPKPEAVVFPGKEGQPVSDMTLSKILRDMDLTVTVHGFRSSFKDWASEATSFPDAVSEAALAHIDKDKTRAAYKRTDFRKLRVDLMAAWAKFVTGASAANVTQLKRKAKAA